MLFPTPRFLMILFVALCAASLRGQTFDLETQRQPVISLDGPWHFHTGDSPRDASGNFLWAEPAYDDSGWTSIRGGESWAYQGFPALGGWAWYRFSVKLPAAERPTSLLLAPIVTGFDLYVDGAFAGKSGTVPPDRTPNTNFNYKLYPLTSAGSTAPRTVVVAIRVWHSPLWSGYLGGGSYSSGNLAGDPALLLHEREHQNVLRNTRLVDWYCYSIAAGLIGFAILGLFLMRPIEREYLAFATMLLAQSADCVATLLHEIWAFPAAPIFDIVDGMLNATVFVANLYFVTRILGLQWGKRDRFFVTLAAVSGLCAGLYWSHWISVPASAALQLILLLPTIVWAIYLLVKNAVKGNRDARLLLFPILLAAGYYAFDNLSWLLAQAGVLRRPAFMGRAVPLPPFALHIQVLLDLVFLLAMLVFLIRRFSLARKREERMAGEFEAARQVQQFLLPDKLTESPGFRVESVYRPADQVGGDFFQQIADENGGVLLVVGDVSGKGLPAAMVVSVMVGAIGAEVAHGIDPAAILESLNARAMGHSQGGFVTCLAAHIRVDGSMTLANAGHLPPYLNAEELPMGSALPLGIVEGIRYENSTLQLKPSDVLTFVSDGVVEAQRPNGELLGFERMHGMVGMSVEQIADTAVKFGQVDDITVLRVEFCGVTCDEAAASGKAASEIAPA